MSAMTCSALNKQRQAVSQPHTCSRSPRLRCLSCSCAFSCNEQTAPLRLGNVCVHVCPCCSTHAYSVPASHARNLYIFCVCPLRLHGKYLLVHHPPAFPPARHQAAPRGTKIPDWARPQPAYADQLVELCRQCNSGVSTGRSRNGTSAAATRKNADALQYYGVVASEPTG